MAGYFLTRQENPATLEPVSRAHSVESELAVLET